MPVQQDEGRNGKNLSRRRRVIWALFADCNSRRKKAYNDKKKLVTRGYQRVREKIKDLRQGFSKAILSGTRSGSGELVYDNYDRLKQLWGGCPNTQPLSSEIDSNDVNTVGQDAAVLHNT